MQGRAARELPGFNLVRLPAQAGGQVNDVKAPVNVRVRYRDGRVVPLEMVYAGVNEQGNYEWQPSFPIERQEGMRVMVDLLPAKTTLAFTASWKTNGPLEGSNGGVT